MRILRKRLALFALCLVLLACTAEQAPGTATEVIVEIDAEESLKRLAIGLRVRVEGGDGLHTISKRTTRFEDTVSPIDFPRRIALVPVAGASDGRVFVLTATALDAAGAFLAEARIISGYVAGQVRYARLVIEGDQCLRLSCEDPSSTCTRGACAPATVDVGALSRDENEATTAVFSQRDASTSAPEAGSDASGAAANDATVDAAFAVDAAPNEPPDGGGELVEGRDAGEVDAALPTVAVFELGSGCTKPGQLACSAFDSALTVLCSGGSWKESLRCRNNERCDTRLGPTQGQCLDLVPECQDKRPSDAFCRGNQRMTCGPDRVTSESVPCASGQVCVLNGRETSCVADPDECALGSDNCDSDPDACRNMFGGFMCVCPAGYTGAGVGASGCVDNDECAAGAVAACGVGASTCTNTAGSYQCTCAAGFTGSGTKACKDVDECASAACGAGASACTNSSGSYACTCRSGYVGTGGKTCTLGTTAGGACAQASDCRSCSPGTVAVSCTANICVCGNGASCSANNQCQGTCVSARCVAADASCDEASDCRNGTMCMGASALSAGRCYLAENSACTANSQCQGTCRPPDNEEASSARFCQALAPQNQHCDENADCVAGYVCRNSTGVGLHCDVPARMLDACDEHADCMSPLSCTTLSPDNAVCQ